MADTVLFLKSPLKERIWGGDFFRKEMRLTDSDAPMGEYWTLSAYPGASSVIDGGDYDGVTLRDLFASHRELFGQSALSEFPILTKIIAASAPLSVQVHPDDAYAARDGQQGKLESWLILRSDHSEIVYGHTARTKEEFAEKVAAHDYAGLLRYRKVAAGNFVPVLPGTVHALGAGLVLLEIQQSSDLTYRLYDYDRPGADGKPRELHTQKALDVVTCPQDLSIPSGDVLHGEDGTLWENEYFSVDVFTVDGDTALENPAHDYLCVTVAEGDVTADGREVPFGHSFIVPSPTDRVILSGKGKIVVCKSNR